MQHFRQSFFGFIGNCIKYTFIFLESPCVLLKLSRHSDMRYVFSPRLHYYAVKEDWSALVPDDVVVRRQKHLFSVQDEVEKVLARCQELRVLNYVFLWLWRRHFEFVLFQKLFKFFSILLLQHYFKLRLHLLGHPVVKAVANENLFSAKLISCQWSFWFYLCNAKLGGYRFLELFKNEICVNLKLIFWCLYTRDLGRPYCMFFTHVNVGSVIKNSPHCSMILLWVEFHWAVRFHSLRKRLLGQNNFTLPWLRLD